MKEDTKIARLLNLLIYLIKSIHLWSWIIFILGALFCYYYPREWATYSSDLDKIFAPGEWFFIWVMGVGLWGVIYSNLVDFEKSPK